MTEVNKKSDTAQVVAELDAEIAVIGGGTGGALAAYSAAVSGKSVILTESTDWLGGQFTSQAVPADEHDQIEKQGCTRTYRRFRDGLREYYRLLPNLLPQYRNDRFLNPGGGIVSNISVEPKVALKLFQEMLEPFVKSGVIRILYGAKPLSAKVSGDVIRSVTVVQDGKNIVIKAKYFLDATDCGDLLPITGTEYRTGAESKAETGEMHAADAPDRLDMQPVTHCAAIDYRPGQKDALTERPAEYDFFLQKALPCDPMHGILSYYAPNLNDKRSRRFAMFPEEVFDGQKYFPLFPYRRIIKADRYTDGSVPADVTIVNWPQTDYFLGNIYDCPDAEEHKYMAKQLTLSVIHWFNTEAPLPSGQKGYRGFNLRGDVLGTEDGLAKAPYIRESRRIAAVNTVTENMISKRLHKNFPVFRDSVGVGSYHIDVHITTRTNSFFFYEVQPFEIPLSALVPVRMRNLIASAKNIGATHLTNGCYRLHPVEWNIGEAAGFLAAYCISVGTTPAEVCADDARLAEFQGVLRDNGIQLHWNEWD